MNTPTNPVDDELEEVLQELADSAWSIGLQGGSQNILANERANRMTVAKAKTKLLAWHSQGVGEVHEHKFVTSSTNMGEWVKVDRYCERCGVDYKDLTGAHHG